MPGPLPTHRGGESFIPSPAPGTTPAAALGQAAPDRRAREETFPKLAGKPHYDKDRRACVLPVKLEPGKTYALWLNSEKYTNFKDADGNPAVPYLLVFETKP
jgi:hypothetical protein